MPKGERQPLHPDSHIARYDRLGAKLVYPLREGRSRVDLPRVECHEFCALYHSGDDGDYYRLYPKSCPEMILKVADDRRHPIRSKRELLKAAGRMVQEGEDSPPPVRVWIY